MTQMEKNLRVEEELFEIELINFTFKHLNSLDNDFMLKRVRKVLKYIIDNTIDLNFNFNEFDVTNPEAQYELS